MNKVRNALVIQIICIFFSICPVSAETKALLKEVSFISLSNTTEHVVLKFNGSYSPKTFRLKGEKPRLVFDFYGITIGNQILNAYTTNGNLIKAIRIGLHKGENPKTRVVLDEIQGISVEYSQEFDEATNTLTIALYQVGVQTAQPIVSQSVDRETVEAPSATDKIDSAEGQTPTSAQPAPPTPSAPVQETEIAKDPVPQQAIKKTAAKTATETAAPPVTKGQNQPSEQKQSVQPTSTAVQPQKASTASTEQLSKEVPMLEEVSFDANSSKGEMVLFKLNGFYPPIIYGVEEGLPRAVCDFKKTSLNKNVKSVIHASGKYVKTIRVGKHSNPDKVRVVLDLEPSNNYDLQQIFFREDNLFVIIINTLDNQPGVPEKKSAP